MIGLVSRNKRRYGGYIVHAGIVLIFLGFAGEGFSRDQQLLLKPGEEQTVGDYTIHLDALRVTDDGQKQMVTGHITVKNVKGEVIDQMRPAKWYYRKHEEEPTTEVAIRRSFAEDLYIVMPAFEIEEQTASVEVHINPLVNWVWFGFGILAVGTGIALLPEASLSFAVAKIPADAVTASVVLLVMLLSSGVAFAQHVETGQDPRLQLVSPQSREIAHKLACWCGGCSKLPVGQCSCGHCAIERSNIDQMLKEGKNEQQILQYYVTTYGGNQILSEPPIAGSGRVVWAMPIVAGLGGFMMIAYLAMRWSRRPQAAGMPAGLEDPEMAARLDDELRNLD
jgi:cytochrome c-type biogenesis protein CcmF